MAKPRANIGKGEQPWPDNLWRLWEWRMRMREAGAYYSVRQHMRQLAWGIDWRARGWKGRIALGQYLPLLTAAVIKRKAAR